MGIKRAKVKKGPVCSIRKKRVCGYNSIVLVPMLSSDCPAAINRHFKIILHLL